MNNFVVGSVVTLILVVPIVIFFALSNNQPVATQTNTLGSQLEAPGQLPKEIYTVNENCLDQISDPTVGAISSECQNYESNLTNEFISKVREAVTKEENIDCAKNLPADINTLHKKIEGNRAQVLIEGNEVVTGEEAKDSSGDLRVEFIRTQDDWEISDIRCLN